MHFKTFLDSSKTWRTNIGNSEQPNNNQRNVSESYSTEMNGSIRKILHIYSGYRIRIIR